MEKTNTNILSFRIDEQLLAIPIPVIERIVRAVEVTPLGKAPEIILGVIDYRGYIIPVMNLRKRLGFPDRILSSSDRLMIIKTSKRRLALVADEILEVIPPGATRVNTTGIASTELDAEGITRCSDGLILIFDPEKFLSSAEELNLEKSLKSKKKKA
ncbi:MAG: chemotaxis protein CheW [Bacteroidia bacterium]|nr:chemotaxis protein CheW [Bacteroidia bacterium]